VVAKLAEKALQIGVRVLIGIMKRLIIEVTDTKGTQRVKGVLLENGETIYGDYVIVAAGAWTPLLLPHLKVNRHRSKSTNLQSYPNSSPSPSLSHF
jgi:glycine/D-amino acid oxidase-like deaminating enzyme